MASLKASIRSEKGSRSNRKLRKSGKIPGIIYGHGEEPVSISFCQHDLEFAVQHGERLFELEIDGKTDNVLLKEVQYDTFGHEILHVDLTRVNLDERVDLTVPVILVGSPEGLKDGGVLHQVTSDVSLNVPVNHIPDEIKIIVTSLKLNDQLHLRDIELPEGAKLLDSDDQQLCSVAIPAEEKEPEEIDEDASLEPEVIGKKQDEEAEED